MSRFALFIFAFIACLPSIATAAQKPNVLIVLVDDVGYGDFACLGNPLIHTPNIDAFYKQSVRLTDFHVTPMCTPTRGELMSGMDALRNGAMNVSAGRAMLRRGIPTMANIFANNGYRTAMFGKWHLGDVYPYRPQDRGFERVIWYPSSHISSAPDVWNNDYFDPFFRDETGTVKQYKGYCTDVLFDQAINWMNAGDKTKPFLIYLPLNVAHAPLRVPDQYRKPYEQLDPKLATFYGMIATIDENMVKLDAALASANLRDNTIVIFMTDNGGTVGVPTFNAGMKGGKISLYEGGHRVPCFIRWPGGKVDGGRDVSQMIEAQDWLPTLIQLADLPTPANAKFDGTTIADLLTGKNTTELDRTLIEQFSRMSKGVPDKFDSTVMWRRYRLTAGTELYDLSNDLHQDHDIAADHPEIVAKLRDAYEKWWADLSPTVNVFEPITIGAPDQPTTLLSPADWHDVTLDQQLEVRKGLLKNAPLSIDVAQEGDYVFELRRWPREADLPIDSPAPPWHGPDGSMPPGKALPIVNARLQIGDIDRNASVSPSAHQISFTIHLPKGQTTARSSFFDAAGKELCGAYYVYVHRTGEPVTTQR